MHHFEPIGDHCFLVFTGESNHSRDPIRWCEMDFATIPGMPIQAAESDQQFSHVLGSPHGVQPFCYGTSEPGAS